MESKEYGGYIEFESYSGRMLHSNALPLNCGRNSLAYLIKVRKIKKIYLPYLICSSVIEICDRLGTSIEYYHINKELRPIFTKKLNRDEFIYIVNYYGQISNEEIFQMKSDFERIIIDNAQSYFQDPVGSVDTIYTCRKYFGVADGSFLYTDLDMNMELEEDESFDRMRFLMGRFERTAHEFFGDYVANNKIFINEPVKLMSKLTKNLLKGIDYSKIGERRRDNFEYLNERLESVNKFGLVVPYGAFMYPLYINNGSILRKELQNLNIYIPILWPNVIESCGKDSLEYNLSLNTLPLPCDQRYLIEDMKYIVEEVLRCLN